SMATAFCSYLSTSPRALHSFPTRRSSDLPHGGVRRMDVRLRRGTASLGRGPRELLDVRAGGAAVARAPGLPVRDHVPRTGPRPRSEEHTSELQSRENLVCRLLLEKKKHMI